MDYTNQHVQAVQQLLDEAFEALGAFPEDFLPSRLPPDDAARLDRGFGRSGLRAEQLDILRAIYDRWPGGSRTLHSTFFRVSDSLGQFLRFFGVRLPLSQFEIMAADPGNAQLLMSAMGMSANIPEDAKASDSDLISSLGQEPEALYAEAERRAIRALTPFAITASALLGHDALRWMFAPSQNSTANLQPHEFSRTGWARLSRIRDQIEIEQELARLSREDAVDAKALVALSWTLTALASVMEPEIFLGERDWHVSSERAEGMTISQGVATHVPGVFLPRSMRTVVRVLHDAIANDDFDACDVMWIANGLARRRSGPSDPSGAEKAERPEFDIFLSHRGRDAKNALARSLLKPERDPRVFLDCLTLPHGEVNRSFVFGSLVHSKQVIVVDTANFSGSKWCLKELWVADIMNRMGLAELRKTSLAGAIEEVAKKPRTGAPGPGRTEGYDYPITPRIMNDLTYWARKPNKFSLTEMGADLRCLEGIEGFLGSNERLAGEDKVREAVGHLLSLFRRIPADLAEPAAFALLSTAGQLAVATLGLNCLALSKMEVRRGVDRLNDILRRLASNDIQQDELFRARPERYYSLVAAAVVIDLAGFHVDALTSLLIRELIGGVAALRDGLLLLDVRPQDRRREFNIRLALALLSNDIASVGIVQSADDCVHQMVFDDVPLEILPCVTLHPGMEDLFTDLPSS